MPRTFAAIALLLALAACNRAPAGNGIANAPSQNNIAAAAPAPVAPAVDAPADTDEALEEGDVAAERESAPQASRDEESAEGCAGEIGLPAARRLAEQCTGVSPATRPPCNTANSCATIREEIERGCGFLKEDAPGFCEESG